MTDKRFLTGAVAVLIIGESGIVTLCFGNLVAGFSMLLGAGLFGLAGFWKALDDTFHGRDV